MGQCSTLPAEARQNPASSPTGGSHRYNQDRDDYGSGRKAYGYVPQKNQNPTAVMTESFENENNAQASPRTRAKRSNNSSLQVKVPHSNPPTSQSSSRKTVVNFADAPRHPHQPPPRHPGSHKYAHMSSLPPMPPRPYPPSQMQQDPVPMEIDEPAAKPPTPDPPDSAVRTRCYKLNLESNLVGLMGGEVRVPEGHVLGPFAENPPSLTHTISDDSSTSADATAVAVRTAKIFRGITISHDGTILSQNARATRANRNKNKRGEKSRQAAKIDKAKDLVEESIATGKAPNSEDAANMVSLVVFGEYDNMNYLVRDGSKKLRDASEKEIPDEELLAGNHQRPAEGPRSGGASPRTQFHQGKLLSPRKRMSPHSTASMSRASRYSNNATNLPSSAPPKLKGHPRDRPSTRRLNNDGGGTGGGFRRFPVHDPCSGMFVTQHSGGESDWSGPLGFSKGLNSFFYCGGADQTVNPTQPAANESKGGLAMPPQHPHQQQQQQQRHRPMGPTNEYRNESSFRAYNQPRTDPTSQQRVGVPGRDNVGSGFQS